LMRRLTWLVSVMANNLCNSFSTRSQQDKLEQKRQAIEKRKKKEAKSKLAQAAAAA
jgi:hypothetical protein